MDTNNKVGILYLDDEKDNLIPFKNLLYRDYDIFITTDSDEAMRILKENKSSIHVIISDQRMPNITGTDFFQKVKKEFPDPIRILLTGYSDINAVIDSINLAQIYRYVQKPWKEEDLKRVIQNACKEYETRNNNVASNQDALPIRLYTEGATDIKYLEKAAELLDKKNILNKITLEDADGCSNLDKQWRFLIKHINLVDTTKIILLYDCDTKKGNDQESNLYTRVIPFIETNPIYKGIENLFPESTINKAKEYKLAFIDTIKKSGTRRGEEFSSTDYEVNKDEKTNLCDWLCENGTKEDFQYFKKVFDLIEEII